MKCCSVGSNVPGILSESTELSSEQANNIKAFKTLYNIPVQITQRNEMGTVHKAKHTYRLVKYYLCSKIMIIKKPDHSD